MLKYVHFESVFNTLNTCQCIHWDKTQMLKKKYLRTKKVPFFFCESQLITVLLLICDSYMSWCNKVHLSETVREYSHFWFHFFFQKCLLFIFYFLLFFFFLFSFFIFCFVLFFFFCFFGFFCFRFLLLVIKLHGLFDFKTA